MDKIITSKDNIPEQASQKNKDGKMITRKSWDEFRQTGLLWFVNTILHAFGWVIVCKYEEGKVIDVYPARTKFRGFDENTTAKNYRKLTEYMRDNVNSLMEDIREG